MLLNFLITSVIMMTVISSYAQTRITVGQDKQYATIAAALQSISKPMTDDVIIVVDVPDTGYTEPGTVIDINSLQPNGHYLSIIPSDSLEYTYYMSANCEFRFRGDDNNITKVETVDGINGTLLRNVSTNDTAPVTDEYLVKNYAGSTITFIDADGNRTGPVYDYYPFGKQVMLTVAPSGIGRNILSQTLTGKELDLFTDNYPSDNEGLGLYFFGARYYDPDIALWTSTDPISGNDWNPYTYCHNNPVKFYDPDGKQPGDIYVFTSGYGNPVGSIIAAIKGPYSHVAIEDKNGMLFSWNDKGVHVASIIDAAGRRDGIILRPTGNLNIDAMQDYIDSHVNKFNLPCSKVVSDALAAGGIEIRPELVQKMSLWETILHPFEAWGNQMEATIPHPSSFTESSELIHISDFNRYYYDARDFE